MAEKLVSLEHKIDQLQESVLNRIDDVVDKLVALDLKTDRLQESVLRLSTSDRGSAQTHEQLQMGLDVETQGAFIVVASAEAADSSEATTELNTWQWQGSS